jgi:HSP20 family molecular chaperone IbpA
MAQRQIQVTTAETAKPVPIDYGGISDRIEQMSRVIAQHAFQIFKERGEEHGHDLDDWIAAERELFWATPIEIAETGNKLKVRAQVPGFTQADLKVALEPHKLLIQGVAHESKEEKTGDQTYGEYSDREIFQSVDLPAAVNIDTASATLANGALEIDLDRAEAAQLAVAGD